MRPVVTDRVAWSVGLSVTLVSPAKTAAPIEMLFGLRTQVGPRNRVLDGDPDRPWEWAMLRGKGRLIVKYRDTAVICAKTAQPIEILSGLWAQKGCRNRVRWGSRGDEPERRCDSNQFCDAICYKWLCGL